jgi:membrane-bound metal-dependent hydrolase YbcI (DUF457 family)
MFIGHYGVGFAAKKAETKPSLGTYFMAAQFIDLLWPLFLLFGLERVKIDPGNTAMTPLNFVYYPFSHSLLAVIFWAALFGFVYFFIRKNFKSAVILGAVVISHWILDLLVHRPDLPLMPGSDIKLGLGLWNFTWLSIALELLIFFGGAAVYIRLTKAKNKTGNAALWTLIVFLFVIYVMNVFGPPPNATQPIAIVGLLQWIIVAWAYWIDRNRILKSKT